jgi:hypothetical protein
MRRMETEVRTMRHEEERTRGHEDTTCLYHAGRQWFIHSLYANPSLGHRNLWRNLLYLRNMFIQLILLDII